MRLNLLAIAVLVAAPAGAMTIASSTNGPDMGAPAGQHVIDTFDTAAGLSGSYALTTGSLSGQYAAPLGDTTQYLTVFGGNTASLAIPPATRALSFYWGSIDSYNTVSFFSGTTLVGSFTGSMIPAAPADGNQVNPGNNRRVSFDLQGAAVDRVVFASSGNSFELDTVAAAVPEPASWVMLVAGFGLVGATSRRRQTAVVAA